MTDGWFVGLDPDDTTAAAERIASGRAESPDDWPAQAVDAGYAADTEAYYERLHAATTAATETAVTERERADDQQLVHAVRAMADCERTANELAERVAEWGGSRYGEAGSGVGYARRIAEGDVGEGDEGGDRALRSLAERVVAVAEEADELRAYIERTAPAVAPNLSALAGPVLAARLVSLAGGLESLAKKPSGTVQVLGAEDALFAHLRGGAPSPKHGIIFTHEYVSGTRREERGSAARALAGKLSIAARIDHYSGDRRPDLERDLDERIERIRTRGGDQ
ncbi:NOP5/NOP56 family protein [Haloarcula salinisoli]|uniref:NOP58 family protein n=1 Tax=Haloarcula salinisoli TaxID=2487746 RepID=A0A8J8C820_9EURY|nr:NOP5/NOP56 family protein [Halomicroarcula salinisoli]MBX0285823.1 NOP58 family protein [Halomicroarcula salinisoli]MBX0302684.1 NOP58 family protein [Halomicroarcula salinisoli]